MAGSAKCKHKSNSPTCVVLSGQSVYSVIKTKTICLFCSLRHTKFTKAPLNVSTLVFTSFSLYITASVMSDSCTDATRVHTFWEEEKKKSFSFHFFFPPLIVLPPQSVIDASLASLHPTDYK